MKTERFSPFGGAIAVQDAGITAKRDGGYNHETEMDV